jgi:hypothetical protein
MERLIELVVESMTEWETTEESPKVEIVNEN